MARRDRQCASARHNQGCPFDPIGRGAIGDAARAGFEGAANAADPSGLAGGEPAASAGSLRRADRGVRMTALQEDRITALCEQLKLARLAAEWPALAQDEPATRPASPTSWNECSPASSSPGMSAAVRRCCGWRPCRL